MPTPTPTAEELLVAQLSAVIQWIEEPPDSIHLEAREKITSTWLRDAASGELIIQAPWIVDGITDAELEALEDLIVLSAFEPELLSTLLSLPWVADGLDNIEWATFEGLLRAGRDDIRLLRLLAASDWVAEGAGQSDPLIGDVIDSLRGVSQRDAYLVPMLVSAPWLADGVTPTEGLLLSLLPEYVRGNRTSSTALSDNVELVDHVGILARGLTNQAPDVRIINALLNVTSDSFYPDTLEQVTSQAWFRDGLDDVEAARVVILLGILDHSDRFQELLQEPLVPDKTFSLPLAGDVRIWLLQQEDVSVPTEDLLTIIESSARISEDFVGAPFPTTDIIVEAVDYGTDCRPSFGRMRWSEYCESEGPAHEVAHYYFFYGNPDWLSEGAANLVQGYVNDALGVETLADRRTRLALEVTRWADEKGIENLGHYLHYREVDNDYRYADVLGPALYQLGEDFLHKLSDAMGRAAMSAAINELHLPAWDYFQPPSGGHYVRSEESVFDTFLKHTPPDREEEFREVYRRLHSGAFAFPEMDIQDEHGGTPSKATAIDVGQVVEGVLDYPGDIDLFRFKPEAGRKYRLKVDHERLKASGISLYFYLQDGTYADRPGNLIPRLWNWKSRRQTLSGPQILWVAPSSFERYFAVENFGGETGPYTLTITEVEDIGDDHGDSLSTATDISLGVDVAGVVDDDFDFDYFSFNAVEDRRYQIEVVPGTLQSFRTRLHTANNAFLWNWNNLYPDYEADGPGEFMRSWKAPDSGVYYLAVDGYNDNLGTYTVRVTDLGGDS